MRAGFSTAEVEDCSEELLRWQSYAIKNQYRRRLCYLQVLYGIRLLAPVIPRNLPRHRLDSPGGERRLTSTEVKSSGTDKAGANHPVGAGGENVSLPSSGFVDRQRYIQHSHWQSIIEPFRAWKPPDLCHKEPTRSKKYP